MSQMISYPGRKDIFMARTVVDLDEKLLKKAVRLSGITKKVRLVNWGLEVLVEHLEQLEILKLRGKIHWEGDLEKWRGRR